MKNRNTVKFFIGFCLLCFMVTSQAGGLIMTRTKQTFPEAMLKLQDVIVTTGYVVSRVQRIDIGLTKSGYATDKYRIVFFGDKNEIAMLSKNYPHLIPNIPWKIAIFAEQQDTLLVSADPMQFSDKKYPGADKYLLKWKKDIQKMFDYIREND